MNRLRERFGGQAAFNEGPARPARDVPLGAFWAFKEHRTMAEIIAAEAANDDMQARATIQEQPPIECGATVLAVGIGIGKVTGYLAGFPVVKFEHIDGLVQMTSAMLFVLPEPLAPPPCAFSIVGGRA